MDSINTKITASSILRSSSKNEAAKKDESQPIDTGDSFVKSGETEKKADFVKKIEVSPEGKKKFVKSTLTGTAVGAGIGAAVGAGIGAITVFNKELAKVPISEFSVDYQKPVSGQEQTFAGRIPTDYYVNGHWDRSKETPLKDSYISNPITDETGKPVMENAVLNSVPPSSVNPEIFCTRKTSPFDASKIAL